MTRPLPCRSSEDTQDDARTRPAPKEAGRRRQAGTPLNLNGRQPVLEKRIIQFAPDRLQVLRLERGTLIWSATCHAPSTRILMEYEAALWYHDCRAQTKAPSPPCSAILEW